MNLFCNHNWYVLHTTPTYTKETFSHSFRFPDGKPIGEVVICACDKCGKIKKFTND